MNLHPLAAIAMEIDDELRTTGLPDGRNDNGSVRRCPYCGCMGSGDSVGSDQTDDEIYQEFCRRDEELALEELSDKLRDIGSGLDDEPWLPALLQHQAD